MAENALSQLLSSPKSQVAIQTLNAIFSGVDKPPPIDGPANRFRMLNSSNLALQERLLTVPGAEGLLLAAGFIPSGPFFELPAGAAIPARILALVKAEHERLGAPSAAGGGGGVASAAGGGGGPAAGCPGAPPPPIGLAPTAAALKDTLLHDMVVHFMVRGAGAAALTLTPNQVRLGRLLSCIPSFADAEDDKFLLATNHLEFTLTRCLSGSDFDLRCGKGGTCARGAAAPMDCADCSRKRLAWLEFFPADPFPVVDERPYLKRDGGAPPSNLQELLVQLGFTVVAPGFSCRAPHKGSMDATVMEAVRDTLRELLLLRVREIAVLAAGEVLRMRDMGVPGAWLVKESLDDARVVGGGARAPLNFSAAKECGKNTEKLLILLGWKWEGGGGGGGGGAAPRLVRPESLADPVFRDAALEALTATIYRSKLAREPRVLAADEDAKCTLIMSTPYNWEEGAFGATFETPEGLFGPGSKSLKMKLPGVLRLMMPRAGCVPPLLARRVRAASERACPICALSAPFPHAPL
jgi:hypothetical protein